MKNQNIILIGMKSCGKSTVGKLLSQKLEHHFYELDNLLENKHWQIKKERLTFREIHKKYGADYFRSLETQVLKIFLNKKLKKYILICGGGTPINKFNQKLLKKAKATIIYLAVPNDILLKRILKGGIPAFFPYPNKPEYSFKIIMKQRKPVYGKLAHLIINTDNLLPDKIVKKIVNLV